MGPDVPPADLLAPPMIHCSSSLLWAIPRVPLFASNDVKQLRLVVRVIRRGFGVPEAITGTKFNGSGVGLGGVALWSQRESIGKCRIGVPPRGG